MIRATSLYEKVYEHLKRDIYQGRLRTDKPVMESELADQLGVSRTPVREALRMLESEGLVVPQSGGGHLPIEISERDVHDAVASRLAIESVAVRLAAERASDDDLDQLDTINRRARSAIAAGLLGETMEANEQFHRTLARATESHLIEFLLARIYEYLLVHRILEGVREQRYAFQEMRRFVAEHERIADAVRSRNPDDAEKEMRKHLEQLGTWYESSLRLITHSPHATAPNGRNEP